jgi:hypothetical protein
MWMLKTKRKRKANPCRNANDGTHTEMWPDQQSSVYIHAHPRFKNPDTLRTPFSTFAYLAYSAVQKSVRICAICGYLDTAASRPDTLWTHWATHYEILHSALCILQSNGSVLSPRNCRPPAGHTPDTLKHTIQNWHCPALAGSVPPLRDSLPCLPYVKNRRNFALFASSRRKLQTHSGHTKTHCLIFRETQSSVHSPRTPRPALGHIPDTTILDKERQDGGN